MALSWSGEGEGRKTDRDPQLVLRIAVQAICLVSGVSVQSLCKDQTRLYGPGLQVVRAVLSIGISAADPGYPNGSGYPSERRHNKRFECQGGIGSLLQGGGAQSVHPAADLFDCRSAILFRGGTMVRGGSKRRGDPADESGAGNTAHPELLFGFRYPVGRRIWKRQHADPIRHNGPKGHFNNMTWNRIHHPETGCSGFHEIDSH